MNEKSSPSGAKRHENAPTPSPELPVDARRTSERPIVRRLGQLPRVTSAFGGSFTP